MKTKFKQLVEQLHRSYVLEESVAVRRKIIKELNQIKPGTSAKVLKIINDGDDPVEVLCAPAKKPR